MLHRIENIEDCIARHRIEVIRYYDTVGLTLALKDFLEQGNLGCRFVSSERRFHSLDDKELNPDITLQYGSDNFGIVCEVKTSLPRYDKYLLKELESLKRYCQPLVGWETSNGKVKDHDTVLLCHLLDTDRVFNGFSQWVKEGALRFEKNPSIWEWGVTQSLKYGTEEILLIRHRHGDTGCSSLNNALRNNIRWPVDKLVLKYETCKFTRKEPPTEYVMRELWFSIFPDMAGEGETFETNIEEVLKRAYEYFIPWSNIAGEFSQVRASWIGKAMKNFCEIGLALKKENSYGEFEILFKKKIPKKDFLEYVIERVCRLRSSEKVLPEEASTMETLNGFL